MTVAAYLERIGLPAEGIGPLDEAGLRRVAAAHAASVPFENMRAHRGERISVRIEDVLDRLVERREGGVCYELNAGLGWLLAELGADVELNAAQVAVSVAAPTTASTASSTAGSTFAPAAPGTGGLPMSHLALIVRLAGDPRAFLVDVGFGGETILRDAPEDGETVTTSRGSAYRIDRRPRQLSDFEGLAWWHSTSPGSRFMQSLIVSSTRSDGIATLYGKADGDGVTWYFRDVGEAEARVVDAGEAQAIAADTFGLRGPLPTRIIRYEPVPA